MGMYIFAVQFEGVYSFALVFWLIQSGVRFAAGCTFET